MRDGEDELVALRGTRRGRHSFLFAALYNYCVLQLYYLTRVISG